MYYKYCIRNSFQFHCFFYSMYDIMKFTQVAGNRATDKTDKATQTPQGSQNHSSPVLF
jgi:hypothetical protein